MQHTLIPLKDRQRLHREYYLRALTVLFCLLAVSFILGAAALFPTYLRSWLAYRASDNIIKAAQNADTEPGVEAARKTLLNDKAIVEKLSEGQGARYSDLIRSIIEVKNTVTINAFMLSVADANKASISLNGTSPTRDELLAFKGRIESLLNGTKIEIPIEQLAKSTNVPFSFRFTHNTQ